MVVSSVLALEVMSPGPALAPAQLTNSLLALAYTGITLSALGSARLLRCAVCVFCARAHTVPRPVLSPGTDFPRPPH